MFKQYHTNIYLGEYIRVGIAAKERDYRVLEWLQKLDFAEY